jgi:hypothetical protein
METLHDGSQHREGRWGGDAVIAPSESRGGNRMPKVVTLDFTKPLKIRPD